MPTNSVKPTAFLRESAIRKPILSLEGVIEAFREQVGHSWAELVFNFDEIAISE
jgi:hypothetical protein